MDSAQDLLARAHSLFGKARYSEAQQTFRRIANDSSSPRRVVEEARFFEARCCYEQADFLGAAAGFERVIDEFPAGQFLNEANQRLFDIANYWLDDTRFEIQAAAEDRNLTDEHLRQWRIQWRAVQGLFHWDTSKPFFNEEGRALEILKMVYRTDPPGPRAEKALFYVASVTLFRKAYHDAEQHHVELIRAFPQSKFAPRALKMAITCKLILAGSAEGDTRRLREARQLIRKLQRAYPDFATTEKEFLDRQLHAIRELESKLK